MLINGKPFSDWEIGDIESIIGNPDFSENEYIDYKVSCAILEAADKTDKEKKQHEFRHDVCAFANADGGFLFFGIAEDKGVPSKLVGISLPTDNKDHFELDRRNELTTIFPVSPEVRFRFFSLPDTENFIVIIQIEKGNMVPYVYREGEDKYRFYVRHGNKKQPSSYSEVQRMFQEGLSLPLKIEKFRERRLEHLYAYCFKNEDRFYAIQIIPSNFLSSPQGLTPPMLVLGQYCNYHRWFNNFCRGSAIPTVDGLVFRNPEFQREFLIYNNHIVEHDDLLHIQTGPAFKDNFLFENLKDLTANTITYYRERQICKKCYVCVTVLGCAEIKTDYDGYNYRATIDRNKIACPPVEISDIENDSVVQEAMKQLMISTCMALSITHIENYCDYNRTDLANH